MTGYTKFIQGMIEGTFDGEEIRKDAMRDEVEGLTIDTCNTIDCGWETGINNGEWIIVEEYLNKEEAIKGHQKWIKSIKENPKQELKQCRTAMEWFTKY